MYSIIEEYKAKNHKIQLYLEELKTIIEDSNEILEGNCFYHHRTLKLCEGMYQKQLNLFWCGKQSESNICEIGFNAGHSAMLLLLGNDNKSINFTIFDVGSHAYTNPCLNYIKNKFSHVNFEYIEGDSTITIPERLKTNQEIIGKYDFVHVDGGHSEHCISNDMKNADILVKLNGLIIIDDTNAAHINKHVENFLSSGNYIEVEDITKTFIHRIIKKIK
jgi:hypothetical protein